MPRRRAVTTVAIFSHGLARLIWTAQEVSTSAEGSGLNYRRSKTPSFRKSTATRQRFDPVVQTVEVLKAVEVLEVPVCAARRARVESVVQLRPRN